ncbi:MAG: hypothetical protein HYX50_04140 [Chloroflexi bacterium]|nr:hypothetical protein [Chloroflexota bacterium]
MTFALKLTHDEPRLVYLALVYHLGRPGSELDPVTMQPQEHGLRETKVALGSALDAPEAVIELDAARFERLLSALLGSVTELRGSHMRDGAPSSVPRFTETARSLFPALAADPAVALELAEAMMMLRRRMERAVRGATPPPAAAPTEESPATDSPTKRRWPFRKQG